MKTFCLTLLLLFVGVFSVTANAAPPLVVLLLPGTSLQDWQNADAPHLHRLIQTGALAVMNTRTAHFPGLHGRETPESVLLTLGAGSRAAGAALPAGALPEQWTGEKMRPDLSVCLDWPAVVSANRNIGYDLRLGSLAGTLAAHGVSLAAGGGQAADWVAAGSDGTVRRVSTLKTAPQQCVIWDAGRSIPAADTIIGAAAAQAAVSGGRLIVLSPYPSDTGYARNERLTPVLVWGVGVPAGLLRSVSTRRAGLVTDTDFAPSVAAYFGIPRTSFEPQPFGFAWSASASPKSLQTMTTIVDQSVRQSEGLRVLPYLAAVLGSWRLAVTLLNHRRPLAGFWALAPQAALTAALFAVSLHSFWTLLPALLALTLLLTRFLRAGWVLTILTGAVTLVLIADMLLGDSLMRGSLLGYSAIEGARYYGIGNEAMGLLLGSALTATAALWPCGKTMRVLLAAVLALVILLLGSSGAKAGGVLVSLAVFGAFLVTVSGRRWTVRTALTLGIVVIAGLAAAAFGNAFLFPASRTHIGEAVQRIAAGGGGEAVDIVRRKLAVEGRLAYHSAWAALLWAGVFCLSVLWRRTPASSRAEAALRAAGVVGLLTCLLFNDAGAVAAAIFVVPLWSGTITQKQGLPAAL